MEDKDVRIIYLPPMTVAAAHFSGNAEYGVGPEEMCIRDRYDTGGWVDYADKLVFGAALESLTISDGDLAPAFFAGTENYTVSVPNSTASVTITPTAHGTGTITVNDIGIDSGDTSGPIALEAGEENEIKIVVENSVTDKRIYTVTVTREADPAYYSIEANVSELNFDSATVGYTRCV